MGKTILAILIIFSYIEIEIKCKVSEKMILNRNNSLHERIPFRERQHRHSSVVNMTKFNSKPRLTNSRPLIHYVPVQNENNIWKNLTGAMISSDKTDTDSADAEHVPIRTREFDSKKYYFTKPKTYVYSVFIMAMDDEKISGTCTGSLLTDDWVLTAAHCLHRADYFYIYAGGNSGKELEDYVLKQIPLPFYTQLFKSLSFSPHPKYRFIKDKNSLYDIAMIKVNGYFALNAYVGTVSLSLKPWTKETTHKRCLTTAFGTKDGMTQKDRKDPHERLTFILKIKRSCTCRSTVFESFHGHSDPYFHLLCHKPTKGRGVCTGDSGGGLVCDGQLVGVNTALMHFKDIKKCKVDEKYDTQKTQCGVGDSISIYQDTCIALQWINKKIKYFDETDLEPCQKYAAMADGNSLAYRSLNYNSVIIVLGLMINFLLYCGPLK